MRVRGNAKTIFYNDANYFGPIILNDLTWLKEMKLKQSDWFEVLELTKNNHSKK